IADDVGRNADLLEALVVHEDVFGSVIVRVDSIGIADIGRFERIAAAVLEVVDLSAHEVADAGRIDRLPLAGLLELDRQQFARLPIEQHLHPLTKISHIDRWHWSVASEIATVTSPRSRTRE